MTKQAPPAAARNAAPITEVLARVLAPYRLHVDEWEETSYILRGPTGQTALCGDLAAVFAEAQKLRGAAIDAWEEEPVSMDSPLRKLGPKVLMAPHSASFNVTGSESRKQVIFRIRNKNRQPGVVVTGRSDHPDRGWQGEFLDYEPGNDPWARSKHAMCNMWDEWEGMREVVAAGGMLGRVNKITDNYVTLEIAENVEIQVQRSAVQLVLPKGTLKNIQ